ncbi:MAG: iron-containing alcohol dehydrogenase [Desulfobacula sp.]|jgi:alcohol dehydrogenase|uniref:iron-containing alcohol dehydrogenase n=1 Tax=Desulfobacula sp. TaxID=2593537 RepID=UPI001D966537|nr:iron-containing alcohol dehydrogenase [Desulfobacula sp.]MBT3484019.1 iron-containing alcohol dehydrogenase [Desulfobacula sp.]MBT3805961.1 iron-containing alcohol dehydrogenase [Desulfobacula sp.]MBT4026354.1 iron-containing alcohol dehydrogenase [Desulfobacula sp.]MBT4198101.1 iron-containing alcohol dehydrogenase [Desulfobacula sp.]
MPVKHVFLSPEQILFGIGAVEQLGDCVASIKGKKVFIVTDKLVAGLDSFKGVEKSLKDKNIEYHLYTDVEANPKDLQVDRGAKLYEQTHSDIILAVGGGSSIDSAKAIGIVVNNGGSIRDYEAYDSVVNKIPPLIAIPTTAGTGCEVSAWAVITNTRENYKFCPGGVRIIPKIALVDPKFTISMPPVITAATGMDALSHAVEAVCSPWAMPQTDAYAFSAIKLVVKHLGPAVADGSNMAAREGMAMAALEAGLAMNANTGGVHALGHQLSSQYGIPHGVAMGIMMPIVMGFNTIACNDQMVEIAHAMGEKVEGLSNAEAAARAAFAVLQLQKSLGLPTTLSECKADPALIPVCAKWALTDTSIPGNPRTMTREQIEGLFKKAF